MFVRMRPDFSAAAAKTHVSDSAVPWRNHPTTYDQVQPMQRDHNTMLIPCANSLTPCRSESSAIPARLFALCIISVALSIGYKEADAIMWILDRPVRGFNHGSL